MLQQIGLYYPYIRFRDEEWLKTAALYWPKLARVMSSDYPVADSGTVRALADELDFIVPVEPTLTANTVAPMFLEVLERHAAEVRERYGLVGFATSPHTEYGRVHWARRGFPWAQVEPMPVPGHHGLGSAQVAALYWDEVNDELRTALIENELAVPTYLSTFTPANPRPWLAMDTALAWVYKCVFVEALARQSRFTPTTDQKEAHLLSDGWDADLVASWLGVEPGGHPVPNFVSSMGMLAIRIAVPANLAEVPVQKIIELRRRHRTEFEAFSSAVNEAAASLQTELADVTVPEALDRYVQLEVERRFALPLEDLRRAMRGLGVETAFSAADLKFELPAVASSVAGGVLAGVPVMGAALGAAFGIAGFARTALQKRRALRAGSPAAYLLSVERGLDPRSLLERLGLHHA